MSTASPPWNEADRLAALRRYEILDTPTTAVFDDFARIAAGVCETPIAVVNLVDEHRQWFAGEVGLGLRETPLDVSICARAILWPGVTVVPDLRDDPRFAGNPLVTGEPNLRFYAGAPLETADGLPLGTLCVLDHRPRPEGLTGHQIFTLQALARQVMVRLDLHRALRDQAHAEEAKDALIARMEVLLTEKNAALAEKDLLVQEVHHRMKNSLATVQSLLTLQARTSADAEAAQQLRESAARVHTFGLMHEHLYRVGAATHVDIRSYLESLIADQQAAFASSLDDRVIAFEATRASWPASEAPSLGLVVVELVTNALKYGRGRVTVTLRQNGDEACLTVEDEGNGLPPDFEPSRSTGLGMRVVTGLLHGRNGRLEIDRSRGHTCFVAILTVRAAPGS